MRVKLDENLPESLADELVARGHDADTVPQEGLQGVIDPEVWKATQAAGRFLITQDLDFSDLRQFAPGTHHGALLVRLRSPSRRSLIDRVLALFETEDVEGWAGCFVIATASKVRVRSPQSSQGPPEA